MLDKVHHLAVFTAAERNFFGGPGLLIAGLLDAAVRQGPLRLKRQQRAVHRVPVCVDVVPDQAQVRQQAKLYPDKAKQGQPRKTPDAVASLFHPIKLTPACALDKVK